MLDLLTNIEQRRMRLGEILADAKDWVVLTDLANDLNCSVRVLHDDIAFYAENFTDFQIETSNKGAQLIFHRGKNLKPLYQKLLSDSTAFQLLELIFIYDGKSPVELAATLSVSLSTIYRLIHQINEKTKEFSFQIEMNPCCVTGDEQQIRYFYYQYFNEKYSYLNWWNDCIDEKAFDEFLHFIVDYTQIPADFAFFNVFKLVTAVNLIRYKNNYLVHQTDISLDFKKIIAAYYKNRKFFSELGEKLEVKISQQLVKQIFIPYLQDGFSWNEEHMYAKAKKNQALAESIQWFDESLSRLVVKNDLPLQNKGEIIYAMINYVHLEFKIPQSGYILYNQNRHFALGIQKSFPKFYHHLYQEMKAFRKFLGKPITDDGIHFFIYIIFIFWENLVPELRKKFKKIQVLVISDRHATHGHMIKDFIEEEFSEQLEIDIYADVHIDRETLNQLPHDLIVTNFPISTYKNKQTVYIENIPILRDLVKLQHAIEVIIKKRMEKKE